MRYLLLTTIILLSCSLKKKTYDSNPTTNYQIVKIDSISDYYLIYAQKNDSIFKILSEKQTFLSKNCESLKVKGTYPFILESAFDSLAQPQILDIDGLRVKKAIITINEPGVVHNLFIDNRIHGLYFCK